MEQNLPYTITGHVKITDPNSGQVLFDGHNAINYEVISQSLALTLADRSYGQIYQMAFGNGGASIDSTGLITYLPPNVTGQNAALYNQTYAKIVNDTLLSNTNPARNRLIVNHVVGTLYTDILVQCLLDYGEPPGQAAFDNGTDINNSFTFDELGLTSYWGTDSNGEPLTKLITHVVFSPVQKSLNRQIQIDYTLRIQSLTNMVTL
jgi:hypothetical protein